MLFSLLPNCSLETAGWRVTGTQSISLYVEVTFKNYPTFPKLNISWLTLLPHDIFKQIQMTDKAELHWNELRTLLKPDFTPVKFGFWYDNGKYVVVAISLCVGIILFEVGYCVWCKRRNKHRGADHLGQTDETGDFAVVTAFNDPSAPILSTHMNVIYVYSLYIDEYICHIIVLVVLQLCVWDVNGIGVN